MKTLLTLLLIPLVVLLAVFVYEHRDLGDVHLQPAIGAPQTVRNVRFVDGFPVGTQVSTDSGEMFVELYLEIPPNTPVVVRKARNGRWLCLAPTAEHPDPRTVPCWHLASRSMEEESVW